MKNRDDSKKRVSMQSVEEKVAKQYRVQIKPETLYDSIGKALTNK